MNSHRKLEAITPTTASGLLRAGAVVVDAGDVRFDSAVRHGGGRILSIEPASELTPSEAETVLAPGFVNAHAHLDLGAASGMPAPAGGFLPWVSSVMRRRESLDAAEVVAGVRRSASRLLATGTTTVLDIDATGLALEALAHSAIRLISLRELIDGSPAEPDGRTRAAMAEAREALEGVPGERRAAGLSPHGVHTVSDALLADLARVRAGAPVAVHWAETAEETEWMLSGTGPFGQWLGPSPGVSGVERLSRAGLLDGALLIHGNCPAPGELEQLSGRCGAVVHCPGSHLYFARAPFRLGELLAAGVDVALGTDSWASNADLDMRREVRLARETLGLSGHEAWRMATEAGARCTPWAHVTGRLGVGDAADIQRLRPRNSAWRTRPEGGQLLDLLTAVEPEVKSIWVGGVLAEG